jgi:hypothetical protein
MIGGVWRAALIVAALAVIGTAPARAAIPPGNLLFNGDAETGVGATDATTVSPVPIPGWTTTSNFTEHTYIPPGTSSWFPDTTQSPAINGGTQFFAGGPYDGVHNVQTATQDVNVAAAAPEIDAGGVLATLSAYLGGYDSQEDQGKATAIFLGPVSQPLGSLTIGPVTAENRNFTTELLPRSGVGAVPPGTRTIQVVMTARWFEGNYNDAYFDNLSLTLNALPPPVLNKSVDVTVDSGMITVKLPGAKQFGHLQGGQQIPLGSTVDATRGTVSLTASTNRRGRTTTGHFHAGAFRVTQTRSHKKQTTVLTLAGTKPAACRLRHAAAAKSRPRSRVRILWGSGTGGYTTVGSYGAATERGTVWLTQDTCAGTLVRVTKGSVIFDDFPHHRRVVVTAGHSFVAHPGKGG